jgi:hypothetical protein
MISVTDMTCYALLGVFAFSAMVMTCCSVAGYINVWRGYSGHPDFSTRSMLLADWFFYLNASLCLMSMLGLILFT